jgi:hypothetical protein
MVLGQGPTMLPQEPVADGVWRLLEELYLDAANQQITGKYAGLSESEKHATLLAFADTQAATSKRWAAIVGDLRSVGLAG